MTTVASDVPQQQQQQQQRRRRQQQSRFSALIFGQNKS